jgi:hypothetical protein
MDDTKLALILVRLDALLLGQRAVCYVLVANLLAILALCATILWVLG